MVDTGLTLTQIVLIPLLAFGAAAALGVPVIHLLRRAGVGQRVRDDGPQRHLEKEGTPTMGGLLIVGVAAVAALAGEWRATGTVGLPMLILVAATVGFACIGLEDDWRKVRRGRSLGLRARTKLALQLLVAAGFVFALSGQRALAAASLGSSGPGALTPVWAVFWMFAIAASSNAFNLADGLDGLAGGLCVIAGIGFAVLGLAAGEREVAVLALALTGTCAGFLLFNLHPAKVFMGDVGSLALGGAFGAMAAWLNQPLALFGLCLVPFIEELSVIAQVISFKTTGKRVFRMSPIHHHFELSGWSERRVVFIFWAVGAAAAACVALLLVGGR